ncbi:hypothetical protein [Chryseobacterium oranimense]|uniref:hypothetical protein n=1 Tax=Chryseobacterium oranimense TaxID=421058 RepID=UPI0031D26CA4
MNIDDEFWNNLDNIVKIHNGYILSNEQIKLIADEEQKAYESNIEEIKEVIEEIENKLKDKGFWTEKTCGKRTFKSSI